MSRLALTARLAGTWPVVLGSAAFALAGTVVTIGAARILGPADYTAYAAFLSVVGVLVGGPAAATELALTRRTAASGDPRWALRGIIGWLAGFIVAAAALALLPIGGWQAVMFGPALVLGVIGLLLAAPLQQAGGAIRGLAMGMGARARFGASQAAWAVATLAAPALLLMAGVPALPAFIGGAVLAMAAPLLALIGWRPLTRPTRRLPGGEPRFASLVIATLVMTACLLAVPAALRPHVGLIPAAEIAAAQIVIGTSRLAVLVVGFFQPLLLARAARGRTGRSGTGADGTGADGSGADGTGADGSGASEAGSLRGGLDPTEWQATGLAAALGLAAVGVLTTAGGPLLRALFGPDYPFTPVILTLGSVGVLTLGPALVLTSVATGRHAYRLVALAWLIAGGLLLATAVMRTDSLVIVLAGVLASSVAPLVVLAAGLSRPSAFATISDDRQ